MKNAINRSQGIKIKMAKTSVEIEDTKKCPECGSKELIKEKDETYCKKCGFVID